MQDVEPNVSTPSRFLTKTFNPANFLAVIARATTTHANKPSGTLADMIPTAKIRF
jgi:hypothetical protein